MRVEFSTNLSDAVEKRQIFAVELSVIQTSDLQITIYVCTVRIAVTQGAYLVIGSVFHRCYAVIRALAHISCCKTPNKTKSLRYELHPELVFI